MGKCTKFEWLETLYAVLFTFSRISESSATDILVNGDAYGAKPWVLSLVCSTRASFHIHATA